VRGLFALMGGMEVRRGRKTSTREWRLAEAEEQRRIES
jgi:hypothetical protein